MPLKPNLVYAWEMETVDGKILSQYAENGDERSWKKLIDPDSVCRVSMIPQLNILPRHDIIIFHGSGERFIKRFGRGFLKQKQDGIKLREYVNCIMTNRYRAWIFSTGRLLVTHKEYEVYI